MNNWSRFVLIIWIFVVLILTQSYTASLASMLTVQRLQPAIADINELLRNGAFVGYQRNSFVRGFLTEQLNFDKSKLRSYSNPDEYHEALSKGSQKGGVDAIFDEIPYIRLFLAKYCSKYTMVGPTYKSDGFGFVSLILFIHKYMHTYIYIYIYIFLCPFLILFYFLSFIMTKALIFI